MPITTRPGSNGTRDLRSAPDAFVGFDVIVADDGRIRNVYGFTDAAPAS